MRTRKTLKIYLGEFHWSWINYREWYLHCNILLFGFQLQHNWPAILTRTIDSSFEFLFMPWPANEGGFIYKWRWKFIWKRKEYDAISNR